MPVGIVGRLGLILVISACVIGAGCEESASGLTPISDPTQRFELPGLSVLPPQGDNWFLASVPPKKVGRAVDVWVVSLVQFVKKFRDEPVTRSADARPIFARVIAWDLRDPVRQAPAAFQSSADFVQWVKEQFGNTRQQGEMVTRRSRLLGVETTEDHSLEATCVRYSRTTEFNGLKAFPESIFISVARGLYCLHPHWPRYMIDVGYTQLYLKGEEPLSLEAEVEPFLKSPVFTTTRPMVDKSDARMRQRANYAKCVKGTGDLDLYIDYCTRATASTDLSNENLAKILYGRGWRYGAKGEYDRAMADFDRAIRLKPDYAQAFRDRGWAYHLKGEYDRAIADFDQAIGHNPDFARAFFNRGRVYHDKGEYDRAIADFDRAIRLKPDSAKAFHGRGYAFFVKGEYDRAIQDHTAALRIKPDFVMALNFRGNANRKKGLYDRAIADYEQAIRLQPDGDYAHQSLAWLLATASDGQYRDGARAVRLAKQAVALEFDEPHNHDALAAAYAEAGQFDDAIAEQERAIEMLQATDQYEIADFQTHLDLYRSRQPYRE